MLGDKVLTMSRRLLGALILACALGLTAYSQSGSTPPSGDLQVFYIYLRQVHREVSALQHARSGNSPEGIAGLERRTAAQLHVNVNDLATLERTYESATSALTAMDAEGRAYVLDLKNKRQPPDMARLLDYHQRRTSILQQASGDVRNTMGEESWLSLSAYIDGEFRIHVKRRKL